MRIGHGSLRMCPSPKSVRQSDVCGPNTESCNPQRRTILPDSAFASFKVDLEEPQLSEGFDEIKVVNFVFEGSVEERRRWTRWMF